MNKLTLYNLSGKLETNEYILNNHITTFLDKFYTVRSRGFGNRPMEVKVYASKIGNKNIYYLHINQIKHFYHYLSTINYILKIDEKIDLRYYQIEKCYFTIRDGWTLREYQEPIVNFLTTPVLGSTELKGSKLIPLQTGKGKGIISLWAIAKIQQRVGIIILPTYIDKWVKEICEIHDTSPDNIMIVQGAKSIKGIIQLAKEDNLDCDYVIFSITTLQYLITGFEKDPDSIKETYGIEPIELFTLLGIGVLLVDETHQNYHALYRILVHTNVKLQIGLSATLTSDNDIIKKMHKVMYPPDCVYKTDGYDRYIDVYPIAYNISVNTIHLIKTANYGSTMYSHIAYEQSIVRNRMLLANYYRIIFDAVDNYYLDEYKENDVLLIFVSTVNFASKLAGQLSDKYPGYKVKRYCEDDPFDNLHTSDIIVSTVISAGTAIDIKGLRTVIQTVSISSSVSNLQSLGRLRKLPDRDVKFCYIYANNLYKQKEYSQKRIEIFRDKCKKIIHRASSVGL